MIHARISYMLSTMAAAIFSWILLIVAFSGLGYALFAICRFEKEEDRFFYAFWTGFCIVLFFLQLWHLALPVNDKALFLILIVGGCCFVLTIREIAIDIAQFSGKQVNSTQRSHSTQSRTHFFSASSALILITGLVLFVANRAMAPIKLFDAGLYHLAVIQWDSSYPIVRGLGNLMERFGMNNSYFLFHAFLDPFPFVRSFHVANGLLLIVLFLQMISAFFRIAKKQGRTVDWFLMVLLPAAFGQLLDHSEDTSPDLAIFIMGALIGIRLCCSLFSEQTNRQKAFDVFYISLLSATAVSIKISAVVFGLIAIGIALVRYRSGFLWLLPAIGVLLVWVIGNTLLTGYPFYPLPAFAVHAEWTMPLRAVVNLERWIRISARGPYSDPMASLNTWGWLSPWLQTVFQQRQNLFEIVLPLTLFVLGLIVVKKKDRRTFWLIVPAIFSTIYWFRAPAARFAGASFWWLVAGVFAPFLQRSRIEMKYFVLVLLTAGLFVSRVYYAPIVVRAAPVYHYPATLTRFITDSGLMVYVPIELNSCWESPLPCTGIPDRNLRLLRNNDLSSGFVSK